MNIFETASRTALRFATSRGQISTEDLWNIPLQSKSGYDLDTIAKDHNAALKGVTDESFVVTADHPQKAEYTLKLEIIKHIIAVKLAERQAAANAAAKAAERQKLLAVLEKHQTAALENMSIEQVQARLAELN